MPDPLYAPPGGRNYAAFLDLLHKPETQALLAQWHARLAQSLASNVPHISLEGALQSDTSVRVDLRCGGHPSGAQLRVFLGPRVKPAEMFGVKTTDPGLHVETAALRPDGTDSTQRSLPVESYSIECTRCDANYVATRERLLRGFIRAMVEQAERVDVGRFGQIEMGKPGRSLRMRL